MVKLVPKLLSSGLETLQFASKLSIVIGLGILIVDSEIFSKEKFQKIQNIRSILFQSKKETESYTNFPIPKDLPFEIRVTPNSKTIITMPDWIQTAIPVFKYGHKRFKRKVIKQVFGQNDQNLINELLDLCDKKDHSDREIDKDHDKDHIDEENFILNLKDLKDLAEEFCD